MRTSVLLATLVAAMAFAAGPASASGCADLVGTPAERPFLAWGDPFPYALVPGGDYEARTTTWTITSGATVVSGNQPFKVRGRPGRQSLLLRAGSSATTMSVCIPLLAPTLRLFALNRGGASSRLRVDVLDSEVLQLLSKKTELRTFTGMTTWGPTPITFLLANFTEALLGDGAIRLQFTALDGDWQIDDVYVDPWRLR